LVEVTSALGWGVDLVDQLGEFLRRGVKASYAGLRPQEARALRWGHVGERTLTVHAPKTRRHRAEPRSVRLLGPLAQELREWRMASGRPGDDAPVIPALNTHGAATAAEWTENGYEEWITRVWEPALKAAEVDKVRPYVCRHSFASLLLHEGRSVVYVARQLGHSTAVCLRTYGHVIEELDEAPNITAEDAIIAARVARKDEQGTDATAAAAGSYPAAGLKPLD
jgi:integrase